MDDCLLRAMPSAYRMAIFGKQCKFASTEFLGNHTNGHSTVVDRAECRGMLVGVADDDVRRVHDGVREAHHGGEGVHGIRLSTLRVTY